VRCPYHNWAFDREGRCTDIPYARSIPKKARTRGYSVAERYGMIFMFRNRAGEPAPYPLPSMENFDEADYTAPARYDFKIKIRGQDIMENSVDSPHFWAVHGHNMPTNEFRTEGRTLRITQQTSVQRFGRLLRARLEFHMIEPGFHYVHFPELPGSAALVLSSVIPIDRDYTHHRVAAWIKRSPIPGWSPIVRRFLLWQMMKTYHEDMRIWQSKEYLPHPVLCDGDGSIIKLRRWYAQFYESAVALPDAPGEAAAGAAVEPERQAAAPGRLSLPIAT
jgi:3-ketosteroid 9alpha-monooxygenase subunit A